jgi:nitrite reductase (NADH) small subunit
MTASIMDMRTLAFTPVCSVDDILPDTGVCALLEGRHVAVFRVGHDRFHAIDNVDPKSGASVLARGLVGNLGEREQSVRAHAVKVDGGRVLVALV